MTEEELTRYIVEKLGDDGHDICMSNSKTLNARYRWLGEKSFTIDPENASAPYHLLDGAFLLFALEPSSKRLRFVRTLPESEWAKEFTRLVTSNPNLDWEAAYDYFDELYDWRFGYLKPSLKYYRDELLQINTNRYLSYLKDPVIMGDTLEPRTSVEELLNRYRDRLLSKYDMI